CSQKPAGNTRMKNPRRLLIALAVLVLGQLGRAPAATLPAALPSTNGPQITLVPPVGDEEFLGPFSSWLDLRRDFGAVGDGIADDTDALQRALDSLQPPTGPPALFLPAGTYRITRCLEIRRTAHDESTDLLIVGEHPTNTVLRWDGPAGGTMLRFG